MRINHDQLANQAANGVAKAAFTLLDAAQNFPPYTIAPALAAALLTVCEATNTKATDVLSVASRVLNNEAYKENIEFQALKAYCKGELA